ncbi:MAG: redox-regulated ATPase YchF [Candidatus Pacebacteria bacterium RIFCSPLOWO2_01_FULL_47_12]|nr:MAG: redox-regulated ATPase YchF [Candidatus Pacebacteria bacterium RIFCSPHIGHO2_02_FULL_46_9]OGJ38001.1 MAG: redox-regulated ATPase YchF [Candidatus Pacebacteria bacterium RIFCSPLOWO2_01_FULL_47_12]
MSLQVGIVGLPNVGKSTLFNALLKEQLALVANYPFATIEPNIGVVPVPDGRLDVLAKIVKTTVIKPATVEFIDIAGLVKGASQGEGLGNQFLSHIREAAVICHVLRDFADENIIREGAVAPKEDLHTVRLELQLADLATLEKQPEPKGSVDRAAKERWQIISVLKAIIKDALSINQILASEQKMITYGLTQFTPEAITAVTHELALLTAKDELYVINVSESSLGSAVAQMTETYATTLGVSADRAIVMCNQIESELAVLSDEDRTAYLADLGLQEAGLDRLISAAYKVLRLQSFLTAGAKEVRAWTIPQGTPARQAAGVIHSDFERQMISARITSYDDFVAQGGWKGVKEIGKLRIEGRDYVMQEGDVVEFLIGK